MFAKQWLIHWHPSRNWLHSRTSSTAHFPLLQKIRAFLPHVPTVDLYRFVDSTSTSLFLKPGPLLAPLIRCTIMSRLSSRSQIYRGHSMKGRRGTKGRVLSSNKRCHPVAEAANCATTLQCRNATPDVRIANSARTPRPARLWPKRPSTLELRASTADKGTEDDGVGNDATMFPPPSSSLLSIHTVAVFVLSSVVVISVIVDKVVVFVVLVVAALSFHCVCTSVLPSFLFILSYQTQDEPFRSTTQHGRCPTRRLRGHVYLLPVGCHISRSQNSCAKIDQGGFVVG